MESSDPSALSAAEKNESEENKPKAQPAVPPRPSKDLILNRCTESTRRKIL